MSVTATPPGWPADLPGPAHPEFGQRVTGWLLDRCPPEARQAPALRRHPLALAHLAGHCADAAVAGQRAAYTAARRELTEALGPDAIAAVLVDLEALGHDAVAAQREVGLVAEALQGRVWREKL